MSPPRPSALLLLLVVGVSVGVGVGATSANSLSVVEASRLLALDSEIVRRLQAYLEEEEEEEEEGDPKSHAHEHPWIPAPLESISRYIREFDAVTEGHVSARDETGDSEGVPSADPLRTLVLTRRLGRDWPALRDAHFRNNQSWRGVVEAVEAAESRLGVAGGREAVAGGAALSLMRLHHVYNLHAHHLAQGSPAPLAEGARPRRHSAAKQLLRASDLSAVGVKAMEKDMYGRAVEWFEAARDAAENEEEQEASQSTSMSDTFRRQMDLLLHISNSMHDLLLTRRGFTGQAGIFPEQLSQISLAQQKETDVTPPDLTKLGNGDPVGVTTSPRDELVFSRLCRGHKLLTPAEESRLKCRTDARGSPYLVLMPARVEELSLDPLILAFRDVLLPGHIEEIKSLARPMLEQAATALGLNSDTIAVRSSHTAWLRDDTHDAIRRVSAKVAALTGLNVTEDTGGEVLQVNLYGSGGHYIPHHDFVGAHYKAWEMQPPDGALLSKHQNGDRIATFMFYMNDVEEGGRTVFPRARVGVEPTKGSAVFWWNLLPNGMSDFRTLHGACPVIRGTKWVSNKWIKHHPQLHRRPCPAN
ncbi:prolyl 4-hydroxylase subunit alpha-3-like [Penaeus japonicus]|uniref:prolyl 4-hydroxylase subunit alpha-3-like n=1 Tax=Penaeus japonicus TaxID=27405 RepID=UPI001C70FC40|nr:prolyl 4-hydroxylase subunit alpha-3-like [Penaeus japonicus]XP_042892214.1 prolyl 4-hydroxylase subunit alpha-3-like [Penaeus japonicus]